MLERRTVFFINSLRCGISYQIIRNSKVQTLPLTRILREVIQTFMAAINSFKYRQIHAVTPVGLKKIHLPLTVPVKAIKSIAFST